MNETFVLLRRGKNGDAGEVVERSDGVVCVYCEYFYIARGPEK